MGKPHLAPETGQLYSRNRRHAVTSAASICHERMSVNAPVSGTLPDLQGSYEDPPVAFAEVR